MNNMELFENFRSVPDWAKKEIDSGRQKGKTDISPMWRIQALTEVFGPCGIGWWYVIKDQRLEHGAGDEVKAFVDIELYYKWGETISQPIPGIGGNTFIAKERNGLYTDDDCFKKSLSDAISVAAKALGVGADVYMGSDTTKYSREPEDVPPPARQQPPAPQPTTYFTCARCGKKLMPYSDSSGRLVSLRAHAEKSMQRFGEVLCLDCIQNQA